MIVGKYAVFVYLRTTTFVTASDFTDKYTLVTGRYTLVKIQKTTKLKKLFAGSFMQGGSRLLI